MAVTLNQVVKSLNDFADAHYQIGHFFFGQEPNFDTSGTTNGVSMIVDTEPHALSDSTLTYTFKVYMGDLVHKDLGDRTEVLSDTLQIMLDFIAWAQSKDRDWVFERSTSIPEFDDSFDCEMYGHWAIVKLKTSSPFDRCSIPMTDAESGTGGCQPVTIYNSDGSVAATVASGGSYTLAASVSCSDATVSNSDDSYSVSVASGGSLELADNTYKVYVDGVLESSQTGPSIKAQTINIQ